MNGALWVAVVLLVPAYASLIYMLVADPDSGPVWPIFGLFLGVPAWLFLLYGVGVRLSFHVVR